MLQHDQVTLSLLVLHLRFESGAERVEEVTAGSGELGSGEETDPTETGDDALLLGRGGEGDEGSDAGEDGAETKRKISLGAVEERG